MALRVFTPSQWENDIHLTVHSFSASFYTLESINYAVKQWVGPSIDRTLSTADYDLIWHNHVYRYYYMSEYSGLASVVHQFLGERAASSTDPEFEPGDDDVKT